MKKLCYIILILFIQQVLVKGQNLGIKGGLDILGARYYFQGDSKESNLQMGFHLGCIAEYRLSNSLALSSGLIFAEKGFQEDYQLPDKDKTTFFYLDIPLLLVCKIQAGKQNFYFQGGPYLGLGLFTNLTGTSFEIEDGFGTAPAQYQKTDLGVSLGSGVGIDTWRFGLACSMGLIDIRNATDTRVRNTVLGIDVAYIFSHRKY